MWRPPLPRPIFTNCTNFLKVWGVKPWQHSAVTFKHLFRFGFQSNTSRFHLTQSNEPRDGGDLFPLTTSTLLFIFIFFLCAIVHICSVLLSWEDLNKTTTGAFWRRTPRSRSHSAALKWPCLECNFREQMVRPEPSRSFSDTLAYYPSSIQVVTRLSWRTMFFFLSQQMLTRYDPWNMWRTNEKTYFENERHFFFFFFLSK